MFRESAPECLGIGWCILEHAAPLRRNDHDPAFMRAIAFGNQAFPTAITIEFAAGASESGACISCEMLVA